MLTVWFLFTKQSADGEKIPNLHKKKKPKLN